MRTKELFEDEVLEYISFSHVQAHVTDSQPHVRKKPMRMMHHLKEVGLQQH